MAAILAAPVRLKDETPRWIFRLNLHLGVGQAMLQTLLIPAQNQFLVTNQAIFLLALCLGRLQERRMLVPANIGELQSDRLFFQSCRVPH